MAGAARVARPAPSVAPPLTVRWGGAGRARRRAAAERQRAKLLDRCPEHVRQCWHNGGRHWWLYTWRKENASTCKRVPYTCESWRCEKCRRHDAAVNFARITEAAQGLDPMGWCFLTLTMERNGVKDWRDTDAAYKSLSRQSRNFLTALRRFHCSMGWCDVVRKPYECKRTGRTKWRTTKVSNWSRQWVGVVEAHRSGWPHMHFMLWSPDLAAWLRAEQSGFAQRDPDRALLSPALRRLAEAAGWGARSTLEPANRREALASYLVKLSGEAGELTGELSKLTQLPTMAPVRFRRLRSGKGFLPPRRVNPEYTGTLLRRRPTERGFVVSPIHRVKECKLVEHLCVFEECVAEETWARKLPEQPVRPVPVPVNVLHAYHGRPAEQLERASGVRSRRAVEGVAVRVASTSGPQPPGLPVTVAPKGPKRCAEKTKRLKRTGALSAKAMSRRANMTNLNLWPETTGSPSSPTSPSDLQTLVRPRDGCSEEYATQ